MKTFPNSQTWITTEKPDHSVDMSKIRCPTLLIWGDRDTISPISAGKRLSALIAHSRLRIVEGGSHDLGRERAGEIAQFIIDHVKAAT
jgi:pimeloyl-ACP methyl ester carboxylesterase